MHRRAYRETSLLVEAFTQEHGRLGLVARGARGPKSRIRGLLEPFNQVLISCSGKGELLSLNRIESAESNPLLRGDALISALYLNEILIKFCERRDSHPELFIAYMQALRALRSVDRIEMTLRIFEKRLLEAVGYGLELSHTSDTNRPVIAESRYVYRIDRGPLENLPTELAAPAETDLIVSGASLLALAQEHLTEPATLRECKLLLRRALNTHLGHHTINSRALWRHTRASPGVAQTQLNDDKADR